MKQNNGAFTVGLTGGIGAGKSTVSIRLKELGAAVIDADTVSREALQKNGACYRAVVRAFGTDILNADETINRKKLAAVVFDNEEKRKLLNSLVHPYVLHRMLSEKKEKEDQGRLIVFDVPLLIESGFHKYTDKIAVVAADDDIRVKRIMLRDSCTAEQAKARISSQIPQAEQCKLADFILWNNGSVEELLQKADSLYGKLTAFGVSE